MNERDAIEEQICIAIRKVKPSLQTIPLTPETRFENLGLQSLERTIVVFELEDLYEVSIVDESLDVFDTIGEARDLVLMLLQHKEVRVEVRVEGAL
jgi:acyl carrier protein